MKTWYLIAFMLSPSGEWVLAPEGAGWKQEPQKSYEECISRRDNVNGMIEIYSETRGKYKLECRDEKITVNNQ